MFLMRSAIALAILVSAAVMPAAAQTADAQRLADLEAKLYAMQEQIRQLKGQAEDAAYQARQANQRLDRLLADMDARLRAVEPSDQNSPASPDAGAQGGDSAAASPGRGDEPGVIGSLPRDALLGLGAPPPEPPTPDDTAAGGSSRDRFDAGMAQVKAGNWAGAEAAFASVVASGPSDPLAANAAYWQGETYYARKDWKQAAATFARNIRTYGGDAMRAPDNVLKLGMSLSRIGDAAKACAAFAEFDRRYGNAPAALKQMAVREKRNAKCS